MNPHTKAAQTELAVVGRLFQVKGRGISVATARAILKIAFDQSDIDRMHELALKAQAGSLTAEEQTENDCYERWGHILGIFHSQARQALKKHGSPVPAPIRPTPAVSNSSSTSKQRTGT